MRFSNEGSRLPKIRSRSSWTSCLAREHAEKNKSLKYSYLDYSVIIKLSSIDQCFLGGLKDL